MRVTVDVQVTDTLVTLARAGLPVEVCGLLVGRFGGETVHVVRVEPTRNVAAEGREDRFTVDPRAILRLQEALDDGDLEIVGVYHSHPETPPRPSALDRRNASLWPSFVQAIVGVSQTGQTEVAWWWSDRLGVLSSASPCAQAASSPSRAARAAENRHS